MGKHQLASALILISAACTIASAQSPCGLTSIKDTTPLVYPPIARAAHISGQVILLATFNLDGTVSQTKILSGPLMLQSVAIAFVRGWQANPYTGPRECPIVIQFVSDLPDSTGTPRTTRIDIQHVRIDVSQPVLDTSVW